MTFLYRNRNDRNHSISGKIFVIEIVIETSNFIKFLHLEISIKSDHFYRNRNYCNCGMISIIKIVIETRNIKFLHLEMSIEIDSFPQK